MRPLPGRPSIRKWDATIRDLNMNYIRSYVIYARTAQEARELFMTDESMREGFSDFTVTISRR